jgi:hypothetical protein
MIYFRGEADYLLLLIVEFMLSLYQLFAKLMNLNS